MHLQRQGSDSALRAWPRSYGSLADFYQAAYGSSLVAVTPTALPGMQFIDADQGAGDWSDAPIPDLTTTTLLSPPVDVRADFGSGCFAGRIRKGQSLVCAPGAGTSIYVQGPHRIRILGVRYVDLLALAPEAGLPGDGAFGALHAAPFGDESVFRILEMLWGEARSGNPRGTLYAEGALLTLAATLAHLAQKPIAVASGGLAPWQLRRTTEHLHDRLAEPVSLAELAAIARLSVFHFARAFKASTGLPPHRYQTRLRMDRAQEMLRDRTTPITEIALTLGYESSQSFARAFRAHVGRSPTDWRRHLE